MTGLLPLLAAASLAAEPAVPLPRAYSHNDYEQARPLDDALDRGFCAVEADVHLRGTELLVAHDGGDVRPGKTLQKLYLDPLLARARANGGRVHPGGPSVLLMVEFKSDAEASYPVLKALLERYAEMLTVFTPSSVEEKAVTVVITGHRPRERLRREPRRLAALDGDPGDLSSGETTLFPVVSANWLSQFAWRSGRMEDRDRAKLARMVAEARRTGRRLRFWSIPDREEAWKLLYDAGVDLLNTDRLEELRRFLRGRPAEPAARAASARLPLPVLAPAAPSFD